MKNQWTPVVIDGHSYVEILASELVAGDIDVNRRTLLKRSVGDVTILLVWSDGTTERLHYFARILVEETAF